MFEFIVSILSRREWAVKNTHGLTWKINAVDHDVWNMQNYIWAYKDGLISKNKRQKAGLLFRNKPAQICYMIPIEREIKNRGKIEQDLFFPINHLFPPQPAFTVSKYGLSLTTDTRIMRALMMQLVFDQNQVFGELKNH